MKAFLIKVSLFAALYLSLILIGWFIPAKVIREHFQYAIFDKHALLEAPSETPRLILVGGSNLTFGNYSPVLADSFPEVKVINTAIHAGYGLKFIIDDVRAYLRKDDIVVLSPEYEHFYGNNFWEGTGLIQTLNIYPRNFRLISPRQYYFLLGSVSRHSFQKMVQFVRSRFKPNHTIGHNHRRSFNEYGDMVNHWNLPQGRTIISRQGRSAYAPEVIPYIEAFADFVTEKGGRFFFSYPSLNQSSLQVSRDSIRQLAQRLDRADFSLLGSPERYSFPDSLYFDSHYHMYKAGQVKRSRYLAEDLKASGIDDWLQSR